LSAPVPPAQPQAYPQQPGQPPPGAPVPPAAPQAGPPVRSQSKQRRKKGPILAWIIVGALFVVLVVGGYVISRVLGAVAGRVPEVQEWELFEGPEGFQMAVPKGWTIVTGEVQGVKYNVTVKGGELVYVKVVGSDTMSFLGDAARMSGRPEVKVHEFTTSEFKHSYPGYKESSLQQTTVGGAAAVRAEFTCTNSHLMQKFKMRGLRITALGSQKGWSVIAMCPEQSWDKFRPIVEQMVSSMRLP